MNKPYTKSAKYFDLLMGSKKVVEECNHLEDILLRYYLLKPYNILDLGCGTGLHSIELSKRDYNIIGLDISKEMIDLANKKDSKVDFVVSDINNWKIKRKFDVIISMWNVVGYIDDLVDTLIQIRFLLKPNGLFIFDCFNGLSVIKNRPQKTFKGRLITETGEWIYRSGEPELDSMNQKFIMKYNYKLRDKDENLIDEFNEEHIMKIYFPQEMKRYLEDIGFELLEITNVIDGNPATEDDWDIRYICRKI